MANKPITVMIINKDDIPSKVVTPIVNIYDTRD